MDWFLYHNGLRHERVKSNLNIESLVKTLTYILIKKLISNCITFTNVFIEMVISVAVDCKSMEIHGKSDSRQGKA